MDASGNMSPLLEAKDVARLLKMSPRTVWDLTKRGELPAIRLGKRMVRYLLADVRDWIERQRSKRES